MIKHSMRLILFIFIAFGALPALAASPLSANQLQHGAQAQGDLPGPGPAGIFAVRTPDQWKKFQTDMKLNWAVNIDFSRDMVIAVFLGTRNTAGYKVELAEIRAEPWHTEITYREIPPPALGMVNQMLTNPYVIAVIEQPRTPVVFSKGFFNTVQIPYGEFTRVVRQISETDYQLQDERRQKDLADGRVRD